MRNRRYFGKKNCSSRGCKEVVWYTPGDSIRVRSKNSKQPPNQQILSKCNFHNTDFLLFCLKKILIWNIVNLPFLMNLNLISVILWLLIKYLTLNSLKDISDLSYYDFWWHLHMQTETGAWVGYGHEQHGNWGTWFLKMARNSCWSFKGNQAHSFFDLCGHLLPWKSRVY